MPRPGLKLGSLGGPQRDAAMRLLQTVLSAKGYQNVIDIMAADQVLHDEGTPYASGNDASTLALFGTPSATAPWMIEFSPQGVGGDLTMHVHTVDRDATNEHGTAYTTP